MKTLVRLALRLVSLLAFSLGAVCAWLFYVFYFKWISVFEDGRYFDPVEEVVYHDTSSIYGVFSLSLVLLAVILWLLASRMKRSTSIHRSG